MTPEERAHRRALADVNGDRDPHDGWRDLLMLAAFVVCAIVVVVVLSGYVEITVRVR